jgi:hypothetical protein
MSPQTALLSTALVLFLFGAVSFWFAEKDKAPSFDVPIISSAGKSFIGSLFWFGAITLLATYFLYNKF